MSFFNTAKEIISQDPRKSVEKEALKPFNYVGFDTITKQVEARMLKRGFQFNIMVVGKYCI